MALFIMGACFSERLIFPYRGCSYDKDLMGLDFIDSKDGHKIAISYQQASQEKCLILYFHGNGEDLGHLTGLLEFLNQQGYSTLALDYRGYGLSTGTPTEKTTYQDADLLYEKAQDLGYHPKDIVLWGRSVGSGPAVDLSSRRQAKALVLESPFATAFTVLTRIPILPFDKFNNLEKIAKVKCPLFIVHGDKDRIIHHRHSEKLLNAYTGVKERYLIPGAGHNDLWAHDLNPLLDSLSRFIVAN
ncbi:MAG: alpha/beta hydrolase [Verrucomicrobiota bacterium]